MEIPEELRYTKEHEWVRVSDDEATVGITEFAQDSLGEVVFVELPQEQEEFGEMDSAASVESVKSVSEIFCPLKGKITAVNEKLDDQPELINSDPYGEGWLFKIQLEGEEGLEELMTQDEYRDYLDEQKG
ncbi:MAG: glycine cleavage system protein GcvH [Candidatus Altiarchaeales archaeon]|nr:glycine cleavage system protein GcvH [Candidatus Altiarchaeales archaeon]